MQSKARMTIRFEPAVKPKLVKLPIELPIDSNQEFLEEQVKIENLQDFKTWNSPYQDDIHALEEIIRQSEATKVPHAVAETVKFVQPTPPVVEKRILRLSEATWKDIADDHLTEEKWNEDLVDEDQEGQRSSGWYNRAQTIQEKGPSWGRVFLSVTGAVATGALFGYMVLSLFTGEPLFPGKTELGTPLSVQASAGKSTHSTTDKSASSEGSVPSDTAPLESKVEEAASASTLQVAADVYYMLQYGVFQSEESMLTAVKELQGKGLSSASETSEGYHVYAGMARTKDEAELLAAQMPNTTVYIKPLGGEPLQVSSKVLSREGVQFMNASASLSRKLVQYSGYALQDESPQKMEATDIVALQEAHQQWLEAVPSVDKLDSKAIEDGKTIVKALDSAMNSMTEYNRKPSRFHLWSVQSSVMAALLADRHMRLIITD